MIAGESKLVSDYFNPMMPRMYEKGLVKYRKKGLKGTLGRPSPACREERLTAEQL